MTMSAKPHAIAGRLMTVRFLAASVVLVTVGLVGSVATEGTESPARNLPIPGPKPSQAFPS